MKMSGIPLVSPATRLRCSADKRNVTAVWGHRRLARFAIARISIGADAHERCRPVDHVPKENVLRIIGVASDQVRSGAIEKRILAIGGNSAGPRITVPAPRSRGIDTDQNRCARLPVAQKNVFLCGKIIRHRLASWTGNKVVCRAGKKHIPAIGTDDGERGVAAADSRNRCARRQLADNLDATGKVNRACQQHERQAHPSHALLKRVPLDLGNS